MLNVLQKELIPGGYCHLQSDWVLAVVKELKAAREVVLSTRKIFDGAYDTEIIDGTRFFLVPEFDLENLSHSLLKFNQAIGAMPE